MAYKNHGYPVGRLFLNFINKLRQITERFLVIFR